MKAEDIDNMQPGRELDTLIHELVMGQCAHMLVETERRTEGRRVYKCNKCNSDSFHYITDYAGRVVGVLDYTTDIKAAWLVIEKLRELQFTHIDLRLHNAKWGMVGYYNASNNEDFRETTWANTVPLAICRAALKAIQNHEGAGK